MAIRSARLLSVIAGLALLALVGCARPLPVAETVEGTVVYGQSPVVGARIQFVPVVPEGVKAPISSAITDDKGFFRMKRDDTGKPGAVIGKHKVVVIAGRSNEKRASRDEADTDPAPSGTRIPLRYATVRNTPLEVEVKPEQTTYPLEIVDPGGPKQ
jgi:hypothetical protein